jgi:hypothetical protein
MADEVLGHVYEVLLQIAIEDFSSFLHPGERIFYEQKPKGISIKPDLTIGLDKDHPRIIIQVSHTNAQRASDKKFWRNIGEFVDARLALGAKPIIANIVFDSDQKRQLAEVSRSLFDGFYEVDRAAYGAELIKLSNLITEQIKKQKIIKAERISFSRKILDADKNAHAVFQKFSKDIKKCLGSSSTISGGWFSAATELQKSRVKPRVPVRRVTTLRRGLGRLLPIPDETALRKILAAIRGQQPIDVPAYMLALGLAIPTVGGKQARIEDEAILNLVQSWNDNEIALAWNRILNSSTSLRLFSKSILSSSNFSDFHKFVVTNWVELTTDKGMQKALRRCFDEPSKPLGVSLIFSGESPGHSWLFEYLMTLIKSSTGKQQGYGYTPLAAESGLLVPGKRSILDFALPKYLNGSSHMPAEVYAGVARALVNRLKKIGKVWVEGNSKEIEARYLEVLFEDKIFKSAACDPILIALGGKFGSPNWKRSKRTQTLLTEILGKMGVATVDVLTNGPNLILWQSATDAGVSHKAKELMGRIGMLRMTRSNEGKLVPNTNIHKVALVIDGTWTAAHIQRLIDAGADGIFYPDEMDKLAAFLK